MKLAEAWVEVRLDTKNAKQQGKAEVDGLAKGLGGSFAKVFSAAVIAGGIMKSIDAASDLNETVSKTKVVFGQTGDEITKWADNSAKQFGLSKRAALDAVDTFAIFGQGARLAGDDLNQFSKDLVGLSADLASFYNTSPEDAINAIGAALRGESEPIRAYGVLLDDATLKQRAMTMGLYDGKGALDQHSRVLAAQAEILAQTGKAQGDFARTADGAANSQRIAKAEAENAAASLGQNFLPIYEKVVKIVGAAAEVFGSLPGPIQTSVVALAALVVLAGPIKSVISVAKDLAATIRKVAESSGGLRNLGGAFVSLGAVAVTAYIGISEWQRKTAENARKFAEDIANLSSVADEQFGQLFAKTMVDGLIKTKDLDKAIAELAATNLDGAKRARDFAAAQGVSADIVAKLDEAITHQIEVNAEAATKTDAYKDAQNRQGEAARDNIAPNEGLADAYGRQGEAAREGTGHIEDNTEAEKANKEAVDNLNDLLDDQRDAFDDTSSAADSLRTALGLLFGSYMDAEEANRNLASAIDDINTSIKDNGKTLDINTEKGRANREMIDKNITAIFDLAAANVANGQSTDDAADSVNLMIEGLKNQLAAAGLSKDAIDDYIASLNLTPENVETAITLANEEESRIKLQGLLDQMTNLDAGAEAEVKALIDQGSYDEAERLLNFLARGRSLQLWVNAPLNANPKVSAMGRYAPANSNILTTVAEPGAGAEAILPLGNRSRLEQLLGDPRIRGPIADVLGGGGSSSSSATVHIENFNGEAWMQSIVDRKLNELAQELLAGRR